MIQEEVNQRTVSLSIRSAKLTANVLARALRDFLNAQKKPHNEYAHGKQTLKQLMKQNAGMVASATVHALNAVSGASLCH